MFIVVILISLLLSGSYALSKLINGAAGTFSLSIVACTFFSWNYFNAGGTAETTNAIQNTLNSFNELNLPLAILTLIVSTFSGIYLFALKATSS